MTTSTETRPAVSDDRPGLIQATPVRHPWRWVAIAVIIVLAISVVGLRIGVRLFDREAILTRWR